MHRTTSLKYTTKGSTAPNTGRRREDSPPNTVRSINSPSSLPAPPRYCMRGWAGTSPRQSILCGSAPLRPTCHLAGLPHVHKDVARVRQLLHRLLHAEDLARFGFRLQPLADAREQARDDVLLGVRLRGGSGPGGRCQASEVLQQRPQAGKIAEGRSKYAIPAGGKTTALRPRLANQHGVRGRCHRKRLSHGSGRRRAPCEARHAGREHIQHEHPNRHCQQDAQHSGQHSPGDGVRWDPRTSCRSCTGCADTETQAHKCSGFRRSLPNVLRQLPPFHKAEVAGSRTLGMICGFTATRWLVVTGRTCMQSLGSFNMPMCATGGE